MNRRTLQAPATITGLGLFTGEPAICTIHPAPAEAGVRFFHQHTHIPAAIKHLAPSPIPAFKDLPARHTCLALGPARAITTEHLMAALCAMGITDADVHLSESGELPIDDGSAKAFTDALSTAGLKDLEGQCPPITLDRPITVGQGTATITALPADTTTYTYHFKPSQDSPLKEQSATWSGGADEFIQGIAPARTFSFKLEAEAMQRLGLFKAFTPRDLLVLNESGQPIDNTLRFENEPARHKLLDLIGDLALTGRPIRAAITATATGHAQNHQLAKLLSTLSPGERMPG